MSRKPMIVWNGILLRNASMIVVFVRNGPTTMECISTTSFHIFVKEKPSDLFKLERDVSQGDLTSRYIFIYVRNI